MDEQYRSLRNPVQNAPLFVIPDFSSMARAATTVGRLADQVLQEADTTVLVPKDQQEAFAREHLGVRLPPHMDGLPCGWHPDTHYHQDDLRPLTPTHSPYIGDARERTRLERSTPAGSWIVPQSSIVSARDSIPWRVTIDDDDSNADNNNNMSRASSSASSAV
jgi:hypothetical protein